MTSHDVKIFSELSDWGLDQRWRDQVLETKCDGRFPLRVGRVAEVQKGLFQIFDGKNLFWCGLAGKQSFAAVGAADHPTVGDFVLVRAEDQLDEYSRGLVTQVLPRRTLIQRSAVGQTGEVQLIAANVDYVAIVTSLNREFNVRRLERYLLLTWESGAIPLIVLNKIDLDDEIEERLADIKRIAPEVRIFPVSAHVGTGMAEFSAALPPQKTVSFLGSSGVGKSSLLNSMLGKDLQNTASIRTEDDRGRHTTTSRSLVRTPSGVLVIDCPGMRELGMVGSDGAGEGGLDHTFNEIAGLILKCRFTNCQHESEPGCAVIAAIAEGATTAERLESYRKLAREQAYAARKQDKVMAAKEKQKWKNINKGLRQRRKIEDW